MTRSDCFFFSSFDTDRFRTQEHPLLGNFVLRIQPHQTKAFVQKTTVNMGLNIINSNTQIL